MTMIFVLILLFCFLCVIVSSSHYLVMLLMIEFMVLYTFFSLTFCGSLFLVGLFFILLAVCVGAYSICLFVSSVRGKSSSYFLSSSLYL